MAGAAKTIVVLMAAAIGGIRLAHSARGAGAVARQLRGLRDNVALGAAFAGFGIPVIWATTSRLSAWDFDHPTVPLMTAGIAIQLAALYLFHRTHADLGANWSARVQLFEQHQLVTRGVYARVRHPMYLSLIAFGLGQMLVVPNWVAGPACLIGTTVLYVLRVDTEERMMRERFGRAYDEYIARTGRLVPRV